ncbi:MAG TPA: BON domain-containing protein [Dongiaceae bacterium]|nr:BON domain-containing protein [Dongiaceae bacterium]
MSRPRLVSIPLLTAVAAVVSCLAAFAAPAADAPAANPPVAKPPAAAPKGPPPPPRPKNVPGVKRNLGGPGDYGLRERLVKRLMHEPEIAAAGMQVAMVNGGVVLSGTMPTWAVRRRALVIASSERGIINVTDQMDVSRGDVKDPVILKGIADVLKDRTTELELKDLDVTVEDGVATLKGTTKDFASRVRAEEQAGTVLGVTRIVNRLRPVTAPLGGSTDVAIRKAVVEFLKNYREFPYLGSVEVQVKDATVTLTGDLPLFISRQQAATMTALVGGVREVVNHIQIEPGTLPEVMIVREIP